MFLSPDDLNYFSCGAERLCFAWTQLSAASTQKVKMQLSLQSTSVSVRLCERATVVLCQLELR